MLFCIETHRTCDFPEGGGGSVPSIPPPDPHMQFSSLTPKDTEIFNPLHSGT